jgi:AcrR family transcriptional regulator
VSDSAIVRRGRGRPVGGGNTSAQARELLLDAAEGSFSKRGYRASTMAAIAKDAGYTRAVIYRHFATRDELVDAVVLRVALRHITAVFTRLADISDVSDLVAESLVIVSTEIALDPVLAVISQRSEEASVADLIVRSPRLTDMLTAMYSVGFAQVEPGYLRAGLRPGDAAHFVLGIEMILLLRLIPGTDDADQVRRYARCFVLPALLADPPPAGPVFQPL